MDEKPVKRRRLGRPKLPPESRKPHRPMLAMRVSAEIYDKTAAAAERSNRKLTEEAGHRLEMSFYWEKTFGDAQKVMADARRIAQDQVERDLGEKLRAAGFTYVNGIGGGVWFPPRVDSVAWIFDNSNRHVLEELLARAGEEGANRVLAKMATPSDQPKNEQS